MLALVDEGSLRSPSGGDAAGALLSLRGGAVSPGDPHLGDMGMLSSPSACPGAMTPAAGLVLPGEVWRCGSGCTQGAGSSFELSSPALENYGC